MLCSDTGQGGLGRTLVALWHGIQGHLHGEFFLKESPGAQPSSARIYL